MPGKRKVSCKDYFLVKYVSDGILSIKEEDDLEHEIITDRTEFWVDDIVMCYWDDMEKYPARIIAVGPKKTIQAKLKELRSKSVSKKAPDAVQQRKRKQAMRLLSEIQSESPSSSNNAQGSHCSTKMTKSMDKNEKEQLTVTSKDLSDTGANADSEPDSEESEEEISCSSAHKKISTKGKEKKIDNLQSADDKWKQKYSALKRSLAKTESDDDDNEVSEVRPKPGLISSSQAKRFKMKEIVDGTGVYWSTSNQQYVTRKSSNETQLTAACIDTFFDKEILMTSNAKGGGRGAYSALNPTIIQAIETYVMKEYAAAKPATIITTINNKCTAARSKCRIGDRL